MQIQNYISALPANLPTGSISARTVVSVLSKIFVLAAIALAYYTGIYLAAAEKEYQLGNMQIDPQLGNLAEKPKQPFESYKIIIDKNIFAEKIVQEVKAPTTSLSQLKLRLVGTNINPKSPSTAIIEDQGKQAQDIFEINELVFNQAKLIEVAAESVKLEYNGRIETLLLTEGSKSGPDVASTPSASGDDSQTDFSVDEAELNQQLNNLPLLLSQARAVPYFRNGASVGFRLFAIRQGSLYEKLGLKNGDIIESVNDNKVQDPSQAIKLFETLRSERSISVKVERNGEGKTLQYQIR
ncbi:PDZ domain-containing protein [bacterium]|nr:PDZ domain-containing protein [bacterium]